MATTALSVSLRPYMITSTLLGLCLAFCSCDARRTSQEDRASSALQEQAEQTITVDEALEMLDTPDATTGATIQEDEGYRVYIDNALKLRSDTASCNSGEEPFREFIHTFASEASFRDQRILLHPTSFRVPITAIDHKTFEYNTPDSEGFFSAWKVLDRDSAVFSYGWVDSELAIEYTFIRRQSGRWYLVDYFNIDSIPL